MSKPTSSIQLKALGEGPASHAFAMLTDLLGRLTSEPDVGELLHDALQWIEAAFNIDLAMFFLLDRGAETLVQARPFAVNGLEPESVQHITLPADAARELVLNPRKALTLGPAGQCDWTLSSFIPPVNAVAETMKWGAVACLWRGDRILGALMLARSADQPLDQVELLTLAQMAGCLAMTLDHAVIYREVVEETCRYRALVQEAPDAMTLYDPELDRFLDVNNKAEELFQQPRERLMTAVPESLCGGALTLALSMAELDMGSPRQITIGNVVHEVASSLIPHNGQPAVLSIYRRAVPPALPLDIDIDIDIDVAEPKDDNTLQKSSTAFESTSLSRYLLDESFDQSLEGKGWKMIESAASVATIRPETEYHTQNGLDEERWIICRELPELDTSRDPELDALNFLPVSNDPDNPFEDTLTRLASAALFQNRLDHCLKRARRNIDVEYAVLVVNLDCFNIINNRFGRYAGDTVLFETARRLESTLRNTDTAGRLSNDEFALLLENRTSSDHAVQIAKRMLNALSAPFNIRSYELFLTASIGIATSEVGYLMSEHVIQDARASMRRAKQRGGGLIEIFNTTVLDTPTLMLDLEEDLKLKRPEKAVANL